MDAPIDLDGRRDLAARRATRLRRLLVEAELAAQRERRDEIERALLATPAAEWPAAAAKARYLLGLLARTPAGRDPRHAKLIDAVLADFDRLLARSTLS